MADLDPLHTLIQSSFDRQALMRTLGARLGEVRDGEVEILLPLTPGVLQQHGFAHAGAIASVADSACGYACLTRMPQDSSVLSIEFKINLLAPATGDLIAARGRVVRSGRTISVATAEVHSRQTGCEDKLVALMQATMMRVDPVAGRAG